MGISRYYLKKTIRNSILLILQKIPISSKYLGPPKTYDNSTKNWCLKHKNSHLSAYEAIHVEHIIRRSPPQHIHDRTDWRFQIGYLGNLLHTPATFVARILGGRICGKHGTVIAPDDCLLADVSIEFGVSPDLAEHHPILKQIKLPTLQHHPKNAVVLSAAGGGNYFHWMFDVLPRLHLFEESSFEFDIDCYLVNEIHHDFQRQTLALLNIPAEKIVCTHENFHCEYEQLIVPSLPGITGAATMFQCEFLRKAFLLSPCANAPAQRLYISRRDATTRRILNEEALIELLNKLDFQMVSMDGRSVVEQALLFHEAQIIVAPHGAALTNLVFCHPACKVLEIFSPGYLNACYRAICNLIGVDYWYLLGIGEPPSAPSLHHLNANLADDITVDLTTIQLTLDAMIGSANYGLNGSPDNK
jgi:capsular polysaccharide biosynthesis protein